MRRVAFLIVLLLCVASVIVAQEARPLADDPELEARVTKLSQELRCLVCQNETIADSRADLANDLRNQVREQMKAGKSDKEIVAFLTERYGDFILYRPPVKPITYLLWFGPFLMLIGGMVFLFRQLKQRRQSIVEQPLSQNERRQAEELLHEVSGEEIA